MNDVEKNDEFDKFICSESLDSVFKVIRELFKTDQSQESSIARKLLLRCQIATDDEVERILNFISTNFCAHPEITLALLDFYPHIERKQVFFEYFSKIVFPTTEGIS